MCRDRRVNRLLSIELPSQNYMSSRLTIPRLRQKLTASVRSATSSLGHHAVQMILNGAGGNAVHVGNFPIGQPAGEQFQHFHFPAPSTAGGGRDRRIACGLPAPASDFRHEQHTDGLHQHLASHVLDHVSECSRLQNLKYLFFRLIAGDDENMCIPNSSRTALTTSIPLLCGNRKSSSSTSGFSLRYRSRA